LKYKTDIYSLEKNPELFRRRNEYHAQKAAENSPKQSWRRRLTISEVLNLSARILFLLLIVGVLFSVWSVTKAHLTEQFLGVPRQTAGLVDPTEGDGALTPDNIEKRLLAFNLEMREAELEVVAGENQRPRPFIINPGEPARYVAARLAAENFVTDADLFNLYLRVNGIERRIEAGNFMLAETMTMPEIAESLQNALFEEVLVTIPEGFRAEEIAERLAENNVIEVERFLTAVRQPRSLAIFDDYEFLSELPVDGNLEGFLFPDTYRFPVFASTTELILGSFLDNFENKVDLAKLRRGNQFISGRELINLASIVEREAVQADERPLIASTYLNRLNGSCVGDVGGLYLQADPTVQYARGVVGNWWWEPESIEEYSTVISPYNTYLNPGLPPNPIANPGLSAIEATLDPSTSVYCFFLGTGEDGRHVFSRTLAEHEQNLRLFGYQ